VLTSNRAPSDWYQLFPDAVVGETLDRLINTSHHLLMEGRSYRPNRGPRASSAR
jgi:DNA replication protein DnaC